MDRDALKSWLESPHRTLRWNRGDRTRYEGVETRDDGLRWFRWSHEVGGGERDSELQSWADYDERGPLRDLPDEARAELEQWVTEHRPEG